MTLEEIHDFGVEIMFGQLRKEGYEIEAVNAKLGMNPQIVAKKNGHLAFIHVRTACYPNKGTIETKTECFNILKHAQKHNATPYLASVGIANADSTTAEECGTPVKGAPYHVLYNGLLIIATSDSIKLWDENTNSLVDYKSSNL